MKEFMMDIQEHLGITDSQMEDIINNFSTEDLIDMWEKNQITLFDTCPNCGSIILNDNYDGYCEGCY